MSAADPASQATNAQLQERVAGVRDRIAAAEQAAERQPGSVHLIAVAKTRDAQEVRAVATAGVTDIGENYLQEAVAHQDALQDLPLSWHFIGAVQSNKTRILAERFDWVHTVDRAKIARRLSDARAADAAPLDLCIQINLDGEDSKAGVEPGAAAELVAAIRDLPRVRLRGLMAIPAPRADAAAQRQALERLATLRDELAAAHPDLVLDVLSMGMSDDLEAAVAAGATHVRIGTALFGPRPTARP
ncbi:MAG TPA: YggS family pyridoxal phosphate-dependent enzyme [Pseudomonadales bacterium]|nr:YggS family pyridoxal phosphate-dependent enzyme [Pseudomonadales bacterium]